MTQQPEQGRIEIREVFKEYPAGRERIPALSGCSLDIQPGEFVMLAGPSGCGKTTLLNAVAGFSGISSGTIALDGRSIATAGRLEPPGADRIVVFQNGALFPWMTVIDNLVFGPLAQNSLGAREAKIRAREIMDQLGMDSTMENLFPDDLSSGMKRQVEIIRALLNQPKVLLLDEPFRALDGITKSMMHEYLLQVYALSPTTILFVTHDIEEAVFLADRVLIMTTRPGKIKTEVKVDLPRPRTLEMTKDERFLILKNRALEAIRTEARQAFLSGERELA